MPSTHLCPNLGGPDALLLGDCLLTRSSQCSTRCEKAGEPLCSMLSAPRACVCEESRLLTSRVSHWARHQVAIFLARLCCLIREQKALQHNATVTCHWSAFLLSRSFSVWLRVWSVYAQICIHTSIDCTSASEVASHAHQTP